MITHPNTKTFCRASSAQERKLIEMDDKEFAHIAGGGWGTNWAENAKLVIGERAERIAREMREAAEAAECARRAEAEAKRADAERHAEQDRLARVDEAQRAQDKLFKRSLDL